VIWAYRLAPRREPGDDEVRHWSHVTTDQTDFLLQFINSQECGERALVSTPGRFVYEERIPVPVEASPAQLARMTDSSLRRGASSETRNPIGWWSPRADIRPMRSAGTRFRSTRAGMGGTHGVNATLARNWIDAARSSAWWNFGCGVGRISSALAKHYDHVIGVDVSPVHLACAWER
jgi:Methyltransferase domain